MNTFSLNKKSISVYTEVALTDRIKTRQFLGLILVGDTSSITEEDMRELAELHATTEFKVVSSFTTDDGSEINILSI